MINLKIKCSISPHIDRCMPIPKLVSGLHAGYVQKAEARKTRTSSQQTKRACGSMVTCYIHIINYFDTTVYIQQ